MPLLQTTEKIFIGYSLPQLRHKDTAERVITSINDTNRHKHIQLYVCEYRRMVIDAIPLQDGIDRVIEDCDLVILLFGADVGTGLAWEARHTLDLFKAGRIYKILPYVFADDAADQPPVVGGDIRVAKDIERFYQTERVTYYKIEQPGTFEDRLRHHIEIWLAEEERIVERQRDFLRRGLLRHFAIEDIAFSDDVLEVERRDGANRRASAETTTAYRRYVDAGDSGMVREDPLDYYLIARHLLDAVVTDRPDVLATTEFINPIHQYLAALLRGDSSLREVAVTRYQQWLQARSRLSERTRSFAAFQLGMLQAREAAATLMATATNFGERKSVRHYAIYALGMLRQRSLIMPLMDLHAIETDVILRDALTNTILFMMGVTE